MTELSKHEALKALIVEVFQTNGKLLAEGDRLSATKGLTGARWQVLGALNLEQQALSVAQIARRMGLQRQSVQRLADILVKQGLLAYQPNPEHKRAKLVVLTPQGQEVLKQLDEIHRHWSESVIHHLSLEELQQATSLLHKLQQQLAD